MAKPQFRSITTLKVVQISFQIVGRVIICPQIWLCYTTLTEGSWCNYVIFSKFRFYYYNRKAASNIKSRPKSSNKNNPQTNVESISVQINHLISYFINLYRTRSFIEAWIISICCSNTLYQKLMMKLIGKK